MDAPDRETEYHDALWDLSLLYKGRILAWTAEIERSLTELLANYFTDNPARNRQLHEYFLTTAGLGRLIGILKGTVLSPDTERTSEHQELIQKLADIRKSRNLAAHGELHWSWPSPSEEEQPQAVTLVKRRGPSDDEDQTETLTEQSVREIEQKCSRVWGLLGKVHGELIGPSWGPGD